MRSIDPRRVRGEELLGLRDRALSALAAANLTSAEIAGLCGRDVTLESGGHLRISIADATRVAVITLEPELSAALLDWIRARRLWAAPEPLFEGIGPSAVRDALHRRRRNGRVAAAAADPRRSGSRR